MNQIDDDYRPMPSIREIPDLGSTSGFASLSGFELIDVIILGDGFRSSDQATFDAEVAELYEELFGFGGNAGIDPYPAFVDAFRVWSVFTASSDEVDDTSGSTYYSLEVNCSGTNVTGLKDPTKDQSVLDELVPAVETAIGAVSFNNVAYPSDLNVTVPGDEDPILHNELANMYRRMVVVMLVQAQCGSGAVERDTVFGFTRRIEVTDPSSGQSRWLNVSFGERRLHEFGHAFAYLEDEYIEGRGSPASRSNPQPSDRSVFLLSNLTYSNDRCDLLWPHLAPGGEFNRDPRSYIGNLFTGGERELGVWHSEYKCLMNGTHDNYHCDKSDTSDFRLRDFGHLCFWCEELTALRILEKTGELQRLLGGSGDLNAKGESWYSGWAGTLRDNYHERFATADRIRTKDACYRDDPSASSACQQTDTANNPSSLPSCLGRCEIREVGNAIYVSSSGDATPDGSKQDPYGEVSSATAVACAPGRLVILRDSSQTAADLDQPSRLITDRCTRGVSVTSQ